MMYSKLPETVEEAVEQIVSELSLKDRVFIANLDKKDLYIIRLTLGAHIRDAMGFATGNKKLIQSCRFVSGSESLTADEAFLFFVEALWRKLRKTHFMRVVKSSES
jgi:hypothetical protein